MGWFIERLDRSQSVLFPESLDEWIAKPISSLITNRVVEGFLAFAAD